MKSIFLFITLSTASFCQSAKPNVYTGRYFKTPQLKTPTGRLRSVTENAAQKPLHDPRNLTTSSRYLQKIHLKLTTSTSKPPTNQTHKVVTQFPTHTRPYTAGAISNILNRFGTTPIVTNKFGTYQSQIEFESPTFPNAETVTSASVQHASLHPNSPHNWRAMTPAEETLVQATSLNTEIFHGPQNDTNPKEQPIVTTSLPTFQYEHSVVHRYDPDFVAFPFVRIQRNLNENDGNFDEKFTGNNGSGGDDVSEDAKTKDEGSDEDADSNEDATRESAEIACDHPLCRLERRYHHDIFLNYPEPHHASYGHVQYSPSLIEKRFESAKEGNRYKGEIFWRDDKGGFAQHHWDMALGKL